MIRVYQVQSDKIKKEVTLFFISDLHYDHPNDLKKYHFITKEIEKNIPNFLIIGGDLLDSAKPNKGERLLELIQLWAQKTTILIILGNHDTTICTPKETYYKNTSFWNPLKKIPNVFLLDNQIYETKEIRWIGITLPFSVYYDHQESTNSLIQYMNTYHQKIESNQKMNILLIHSLLGLNHPSNMLKMPYFQTIDFVLSGHTHNGCVPRLLEPIFQNRGLISPRKTLFPPFVRGTFRYQNTTFIISGGITKLSKRSKLSFLDHFWTHELTKIKIKPIEKETK